ncbi:MAG: glucokinase [Pseudomonadota bacterium]
MKLLVGDIGGTNARFRLLEGEGRQWCLRHQSNWPSARFDSLEALLEELITGFSRLERVTIDEAWLAVAGPVHGARVTFTNLPWRADAHALAARFGWRQVFLVNDLQALAHAVPALGAQDLVNVQEGQRGNNNHLVIAVGTGLGVASLKTSGPDTDVFASEGGHSDFTPATQDHFRLMEYLRDRYGHASQERVLSGAGLVDLYQFVCREHARTPEPAIIDAEDPAAMVNQQAGSGQAPMALAAVELFAELLGRFAGNAALFSAAFGGVYLAGGVATRLHPYLTGAGFRGAFQDRGRMKPIMNQIPVWTVTGTDVGLNGITALGTRHAITGTPIAACPADSLADNQPLLQEQQNQSPGI